MVDKGGVDGVDKSLSQAFRWSSFAGLPQFPQDVVRNLLGEVRNDVKSKLAKLILVWK